MKTRFLLVAILFGFQFSLSAQEVKPGSQKTFTRKDIAQLPSQALYVVDGTVAGTHKRVIKKIKPANINSLNRLTDPAATAVYGTRGANGVIVITTKEPQPGK